MLSVLNVKVNDAFQTPLSSAKSSADRRQLERDRQKKMRIYFFHSGETILDNLQERRSRPEKEYRKLFTEVLTKANIPMSHVAKIRWSQKAGCGCGCSPGFIVEDKMGALKGREVFVDVADTQLNLKV